MNELELLVKEITEIDTFAKNNKGVRELFQYRKKASELRQKAAKLMDTDYAVVNGWYLHKQHHRWGETVAFYTKEAWNKREEFLNQNKKLDWI